MNEIVLLEPDKRGFQKGLDYCKKWSAEHQAEIGVAEMALGAGLIAWGLQSGQIQMGYEFVLNKLSDSGIPDNLGAKAGAILGSVGWVKVVGLGKIGVAAAGTAISIPAWVAIGGSAAIFSLLGKAAEHAFSTPPAGWGDFFSGATALTVGTALLIDGARRIVKDERVLQMASNFKDGVIQLAPATSEIVAKTWEELQSIITELSNTPAAAATSGTAAVAGAAIGGSLAAGSVTVLGSHGLGAVALSLGLVSAPVWPVIAGGAAGLAIGVATWKGIQHYRNKQSDAEGQESPSGRLLPNPNKN